jgi:hypothetical protein
MTKLFQHFDHDNLWFMDICYVVSTNTPEENQYIKQVLDNIVNNTTDSNILNIIKKEHLDLLYRIIDKKEPEIELYQHTYSSVDIPKLVNEIIHLNDLS